MGRSQVLYNRRKQQQQQQRQRPNEQRPRQPPKQHDSNDNNAFRYQNNARPAVTQEQVLALIPSRPTEESVGDSNNVFGGSTIASLESSQSAVTSIAMALTSLSTAERLRIPKHLASVLDNEPSVANSNNSRSSKSSRPSDKYAVMGMTMDEASAAVSRQPPPASSRKSRTETNEPVKTTVKSQESRESAPKSEFREAVEALSLDMTYESGNDDEEDKGGEEDLDAWLDSVIS